MSALVYGVVTAMATGVTWCFCSAAASLVSSCCGNDKPSTIPPGASSGRRRSVLLLLLAIAIGFAFQYGIAPALVHTKINNYVTRAWTDDCHQATVALQEKCAGNSGAFRAASSATLFFVLATMAVYCKPTANREAWPAKYVLFFFLCLATCFIPNKPLFSEIYLNIARIGAVIFIFFQSIIILDLAFNWNESWVNKSNAAEAEEAGRGKKWLVAILVSCAIMYGISVIGIGLMLHYFTGCGTNNAFISVTIIMAVLVTVAQLSGEEASLLTSAVIVLYATFLCYTAVAKNPDGSCNPQLGHQDPLGIALGIGVTLISLAWTGWSSTAAKRVAADGNDEDAPATTEADGGESSAKEKKVAGVVTESQSADEETGKAADKADEKHDTFNNSWKLNIILALMSCWFGMALTSWGSVQTGGNSANPSVGRVGMWMVVASQWVVLALYMWTLVAPKLFPGREFS